MNILFLIVASIVLTVSCQQATNLDPKSASNRSMSEPESTPEETSATANLSAGVAGYVETLIAKITVKAGSFKSAVNVLLKEVSKPVAAQSFKSVSKALVVSVTDASGNKVKEISLPLEVSLKSLNSSTKNLWVLIVDSDGKKGLVLKPKISGTNLSFNISITGFTAIAIEAGSEIPSDVDFTVDEKGVIHLLTTATATATASPTATATPTSSVTATTLAAPTNLSVTAGDTENSLTWDAVSGAASYKIYYKTSSGVSTTDAYLTSSTNSKTHTGLTNGTSYYYKVVAIDSSGSAGSLPTEVSGSPRAPHNLQFDGSDDYVSASDSALPSGADSRTIAMWINPTNVTGNICFFIYGSGGATQMMALAIVNGAFHMTQNGAGPSGGTISTNTWQHVMYTYDSATDTHVLYINNTQVATSTASFSFNTQLGGALYFGRYLSSSGYYSGKMDDVRVYNKVLSSPERAAIYNSGSVLTSNASSGLVGWWKLDEGTGTTTTDASSSGQNGTLNNGIAWRETSPTATYTQTAGTCLTPAQDVTISNPVQNATTYSIEMWVKITSSEGGDQDYVYASDSGGTPQNNGFIMAKYLGCGLCFWTHNGIGPTGTSFPAADSWHHLAFVAMGAVAKEYLNGSLVATKSSGWPTTAMNYTHLTFAKSKYGGPNSRYVEGIAVYNDAKYYSNFTPPTRPGGCGS